MNEIILYTTLIRPSKAKEICRKDGAKIMSLYKASEENIDLGEYDRIIIFDGIYEKGGRYVRFLEENKRFRDRMIFAAEMETGGKVKEDQIRECIDSARKYAQRRSRYTSDGGKLFVSYSDKDCWNLPIPRLSEEMGAEPVDAGSSDGFHFENGSIIILMHQYENIDYIRGYALFLMLAATALIFCIPAPPILVFAALSASLLSAFTAARHVHADGRGIKSTHYRILIFLAVNCASVWIAAAIFYSIYWLP